jgi:hypothetical protein
MWKIATLMLVTAVFAGQLIANPPGLSAAEHARLNTVAAHTQMQAAAPYATPTKVAHRGISSWGRKAKLGQSQNG